MKIEFADDGLAFFLANAISVKGRAYMSMIADATYV